jgi:hypothetical protein
MAHAAPFGRVLLPSSARARNLCEKCARLSFLAQGAVYSLLGILAVQAALAGRSVSRLDTKTALETLRDQPFGQWLLFGLALALLLHSLFRLVQAFADTEREGTGGKGLINRAGYLVSGISYGILCFLATKLAIGYGISHSLQEEEAQSRQILDLPGGAFLLGLIGAIFFVSAAVEAWSAVKCRFLEDVQTWKLASKAQEALRRLGQWGHGARAVTGAIIGVFLMRAAWYRDPKETHDLGDAMNELMRQPYGQILLAVVASGFIAYGLFCFALARYRRISLKGLTRKT